MAESKTDILRRLREGNYTNASKPAKKPQEKPANVEELKKIADKAIPKQKRKYTKRKK